VNLLGMRTEVEKLLTAKPGVRNWQESDLDQIVSYREDHEIGKLLEAIAERQLTPAIERLRALLASKEPEALILWSIGDLFRQALKNTAPRGTHPGGSAGWYRPAGRSSTFDFAQRALRRYSPQELGLALRRTRDTDLAVKSAWKDSKILLEILIWQVTVGRDGSALVDDGRLSMFD